MRILLVDDHKIVCEGLRHLLEGQPDMKVVGEATDGRTAVRMARELLPDLVIMDIVMPELNGSEATRQICAECPRTRVIALSMHADRRYVVGMLAAGASGYVLKDCVFEELARAARLVHEGKVYLSPSIAGTVMEDYVKRLASGESAPRSPLSPRETEVLQLLAEGRSTRDIARRLHVSSKTVDTHRRNIMDKLELRTVADLVKYAIREGITSVAKVD